jgi:hypothetical protein
MNSIDLLFHTGRFDLSIVGDHFINPCCFGEDLAAWLRERLIARGIHADLPGQEDWGWYLGVKRGAETYLLGMSGNADEDSTNKNAGEWHIIIERKRSLGQRLRNAGKIADDDPIIALIEGILGSESDFRNIRRDSTL